MKKWIILLLIGLASCGVFRKKQNEAEKPIWRVDAATELVEISTGQQALYVAFDSLYYLPWLAEAGMQIDLTSTPQSLSKFSAAYERGQFNNYSTVEILNGRPKSEKNPQFILIDRAELFLSAADFMELLVYSWEKLDKGGSLFLIRPKDNALPKGMEPPAQAGEGASAGKISLRKQTIDTTLSPFVYIQIIQK